ncbi:disintegrin and metalloproteinase domain-containing protein 12-like [Uranotaenia lowii]|uniref:disintegrin and metalloproteinase domain-containing protein 12-like n=1 Tax=Uranotaenia lowii TaxID=190385 RepID=UPI002478A7F8|nr:disintegrin and metalloproteinase domain-containing protein 12-like [Uranotaenia lowii]
MQSSIDSSAFVVIFTVVIVLLTTATTLCGGLNADRPIDTGGKSGSDSRGGFVRYARIFPTLHHHHNEDELADVESSRSENSVCMRFLLDGENITLDMVLNDELVPIGHFISAQEAGKDVLRELRSDEIERCHYQGTVRGRPESTVALSTCNGSIQGVIYDVSETFLIENEMDDGSSNFTMHYLYRRLPLEGEIIRVRRALEATPTAPTEAFQFAYKSNANSLFVELVLVIDNGLYRADGNLQRIHKYCLNLVNIMNTIYRPLNIFIALVGVVVWTEQNQIDISLDSKKTLDNFLAYRRTTLLKMIPHDNAHLLTSVHFNESVVGKAEMGSMCTYAGSGGVEVIDSEIIALQASTVAHEMGHNFNIDHDERGCSCPGGSCVMASKTVRSQAAPNQWSSCSRQHLETALKHGVGACLNNKPEKLLVRSTCGNGLVEPGEECDCGLTESCDTKCCDAKTCRLTVNSTCAGGACCDLDSCQLKSAGTRCRASVGECDLPEFCSGQSAVCPKDVYLRDTESCADGNAYCYQGRCRTRDSQCKLLWGSTGKSVDDYCYQTNRNGSIFGNCGNDLLTGQYTKCSQEDMMCGLLHCSHRNEKLDYGMQAYSKLTTTKFSHYGPRGTVRETICNTAIVDLGLDVINPGLVPDGAKCGDGKMCYNQKCMSLNTLRENDVGEECANGCSGHGVCNSEGNCHCDKGYGGPYCEESGSGGSVDSGPIRDDSDATSITVSIAFTLLLFSLIAACAFMYRNMFADQLRKILAKFRMRKYGHMVPPASPSIIPPNKPLRLEISQPALNTSTSTTVLKKSDTLPFRAAPPPPTISKVEPVQQNFIKVNFNNGKITVENKVANSPFLLSSPLLDTCEAIHEFKSKCPPVILNNRSISVSSEGPLLDQEKAQASNDPQPLEQTLNNTDIGTLISQVKLKKVQDFHTNRSKSDEKSHRQLPQLPRQITIGEFQSVVAEIHPKRSPATEQPPQNPFSQVTLKKTKQNRTPNLSRENLDEITQDTPEGQKQRPIASIKPQVNQSKPSLPQKPQAQPRSAQDQHPSVAPKPKPSGGRKLPITPGTNNGTINRPPLQRKPAIVISDDIESEPSGVAALKAKLNLDQRPTALGGVKR